MLIIENLYIIFFNKHQQNVLPGEFSILSSIVNAFLLFVAGVAGIETSSPSNSLSSSSSSCAIII